MDECPKRKILRRYAVPSENLCGHRTSALFQVKQARSIRRFWTLDELRQRPPYTPVMEPTKKYTFGTSSEVNPWRQFHSIRRPQMNPERCERCFELEEKVELLMIRNDRLKKRIGTLEADILMLIE